MQNQDPNQPEELQFPKINEEELQARINYEIEKRQKQMNMPSKKEADEFLNKVESINA